MAVALAVSGLRKAYGATVAVADVSFDVQSGETFGLLGPNGAGKTTTLECILGLREADAGAISIDGIDARLAPRETKQKLGAALQATTLQDQITTREALAMFGAFYRRSIDPDILLRQVDLQANASTRFSALSGGQRQRLAIALSLVNDPTVLVLDEPTAGLDARGRRELHAVLERFRREGRTVLVTTHDLREAGQLCDRVAIIDRGRVVALGAPGTLSAQRAAHPTVVMSTSRPVDGAWLRQTPGVTSVIENGRSVSFDTATVETTLSEVLRRLGAAGIAVTRLQVQTATDLEELFFTLTAGDEAGTAGA